MLDPATVFNETGFFFFLASEYTFGQHNSRKLLRISNNARSSLEAKIIQGYIIK